MKKVLFVCTQNSARSQMSAAFLNKLAGGNFIAESAGLKAGSLNPLVVEAMAEVGYDISKNTTNSVFDYFKEGRRYNVIVKVCDQESGQRCPVFPLTQKVLDWNLEDPAEFVGTEEEKEVMIRQLRDEIETRVKNFIEEYEDAEFKNVDRNLDWIKD